MDRPSPHSSTEKPSVRSSSQQLQKCYHSKLLSLCAADDSDLAVDAGTTSTSFEDEFRQLPRP